MGTREVLTADPINHGTTGKSKTKQTEHRNKTFKMKTGNMERPRHDNTSFTIAHGTHRHEIHGETRNTRRDSRKQIRETKAWT